MSLFSPYRLIDIFSLIDPALVEEEIPEKDPDFLQMTSQEPTKWTIRKRVAVVTSTAAAGSLAIAGIVAFAIKRHEPGKAA